MEKTLLLKRQDFIDNLIQLINESKLPLVVISPIMNDMLKQINLNIKQQYQKEKQQYIMESSFTEKERLENENIDS